MEKPTKVIFEIGHFPIPQFCPTFSMLYIRPNLT